MSVHKTLKSAYFSKIPENFIFVTVCPPLTPDSNFIEAQSRVLVRVRVGLRVRLIQLTSAACGVLLSSLRLSIAGPS